jgi:putative tryptophan/tyrosine transport system substrate-binding protein
MLNVKRREFITLLGGAAAAWPFSVNAQQPAKTVRIGVLATLPLPPVQRFFRKLREYGYIEGRNLRLEPRFAEGDDNRYLSLAAELVAIPVDIIVTWGTPAALAAKQATRTIPIVMGAIADPVSVGIVSNLARPEGNITGFASLNADLEVKRLELLKDLLPQLARVGVLGNTANPFLEVALKNLRPTAEQLGVAVELVQVQNSDQIEDALVRLEWSRPDAVLISADNLLLTKRNEIATALNRSKLPAVYAIREFAAARGLIIHGANLGVLFERAAGYVDRVLKGARPADLPVQLATEFELIVNLRAAAAIGLNIPPTFIARADEVIE